MALHFVGAAAAAGAAGEGAEGAEGAVAASLSNGKASTTCRQRLAQVGHGRGFSRGARGSLCGMATRLASEALKHPIPWQQAEEAARAALSEASKTLN